jgi:hypothetical protein
MGLQAAVHLGHMPWALAKEEEEKKKKKNAPYTQTKCQPSMLSGKYILCHHLLYQMFIIPANKMVKDEIHDCGKNRR